MDSALKAKIADCVAEFLEAPEAWEGAQICINRAEDKVMLADEEEADGFDDSWDIYDVMDFIAMTPEGKWISDVENTEL
ncbi:MAG: hypothetical protein K2M87_07070 [Muribaculaceae bacterium]|nr:hypothetical protein [Muribaculaceae bacterium]